MMGLARKAKIPKDLAQAWTYSTLDKLYPAVPAEPQEPAGTGEEQGQTTQADAQAGPQTTGNVPAITGECPPPEVQAGAHTRGLGDLPSAWPPLPANASLAAEVAWVQANRLLVVEELASGGTRVRLDRARAPAPSMAALAWLETSIRSYAKWVEVAAKASGAGQDDQDEARRERLAIDEVRALLAEMLE
jgi:hypothetical protein